MTEAIETKAVENTETEPHTERPKYKVILLGLVLYHLNRLHDNRHWKHKTIKERAEHLINLFEKSIFCEYV